MNQSLAVDMSMLSATDIANLALQRSAVLGSGSPANALVRAWQKGDESPLRAAVAQNGADYARKAAGLIEAEFRDLEGLLRRLAPRRMADIGCGYAIFDLFAFRALDCDLLLIDVEQTESRHFGFTARGAGYSSLTTARAFLTGNGVPAHRIVTWNPEREELPEQPPVDLAVSFLSCGFHYPVDMYLPFFRHAVAARGAAILDLRGKEADGLVQRLSPLGRVRTLHQRPGLRRVLVKKIPG